MRPPNTLLWISACPKQDFAPCHRHSPPKNKIRHSVSLPPLLFDKGFTISKLISFPSWETIPGNDHRSPEWESALLPIFGSSEESNQDFCSESSLPQPLCNRQLLCPPNSLVRVSAGPKKDFAPCHRHPHTQTNNTLPALLTFHIA